MDLRPLRSALSSLRSRVRALYLLHGAGRGAAILAGLLLLSFALDVLLAPPRPVRAIHGILSLAALAWAVRRHLLLPARAASASLSDEELALAIEARVPRLQDRLVGALQWERILADPETGESRAFMEASVAEAAVAVNGVRAAALTDPRPARRSALLGAAATGLFLAVTAAWHEEASVWARRSLLLIDEEWPRRTTLVVVGFDPERPRVVTIGEDLPVQVRVEGAVPPEGVLIHYRAAAGEDGRAERDARAMLQSSEDPRSFAFVFHEVPGSFRFHVTGGDDDDGEPQYAVHALVPPAVASIAASLVFPPATGLPPERREEGDLEVPAGTTVDFALVSNVPLRSAALVHPAVPGTAPRDLPLGPDGTTFSFSLVAKESADWRVDLVSLEGARSIPARCTHRITAQPDPRPEVRMVLPATRVFAMADGRVPVRVVARDNYALRKVALEVVPGRGQAPVEIGMGFAGAPGGEGAPQRPPREAVAYRLLDLASLGSPDGQRPLPREDEILLRGTAEDNAGSAAATEPVAVQVTDAPEMLRRLSQRQVRLREDLEDLRRHVEGARKGAVLARAALGDGAAPTAQDREALRPAASLASRSAREASAAEAAFGEVLLTYCLNRLVEPRVAADRVVSITDDWLRADSESPEVPYKPALWRRLAAARESREVDDDGIVGSLLRALGLTDRLAEGPAAVLRDRLDALAGGSAPDPAAAAAEAVKAADEALALLREIGLQLQEWETLHEILEQTRSIVDQQEAILRGLGVTPGPDGGAGDRPKGR